jgi:hypothetical protein
MQLSHEAGQALSSRPSRFFSTLSAATCSWARLRRTSFVSSTSLHAKEPPVQNSTCDRVPGSLSSRAAPQSTLRAEAVITTPDGKIGAHRKGHAMRSYLWLLAAPGHLASANLLLGQELDHRGALIWPRETGASDQAGVIGWTPRPTEAPFVGDRADILELARRRGEWVKAKRQTSNTWLNDQTCGWVAGTEGEYPAQPVLTCCC